MNLNQAIVFAILMENHEGILGKSQAYIKEKVRSVESMEFPERLLEHDSHEKFRKWHERWNKN